MIRTKGEAGTGDIIEAVRHMRAVNAEISKAKALDTMELRVMAKEIGAPYDLLKETAERGRLRTYFWVLNRCFRVCFLVLQKASLSPLLPSHVLQLDFHQK